jgi:hypothetical protein
LSARTRSRRITSRKLLDAQRGTAVAILYRVEPFFVGTARRRSVSGTVGLAPVVLAGASP